MEDLTTFYKTLRDIYKEDKIKKKKKFLEELIKNKQPNCVFCGKPSEILCEICVKDVHRDSPDLETTLFCDVFEQYRYIKKMRRIAVYEYLFKQVGSVYNGYSNESDINTLLRRLNEFNFQFNNLIVDIFTSKDEKIMFSNFKMKIHKELIRNYYLINLFYKAEVIEEHLQRMKKEKYDSNEIENEVLNVYKEIYNEI